jgi:hypothetical protein
LAPEMIIAPKPDINRTNMQARRIFTVREEPLNSFQINMPHRAAIMGAPCPNA